MKSYHQGLCSWQYVDAGWQSSSRARGLPPCWPPAVDILKWSKLLSSWGETRDLLWINPNTINPNNDTDIHINNLKASPISMPPAVGSSASIFPTGSVESWAAVNPCKKNHIGILKVGPQSSYYFTNLKRYYGWVHSECEQNPTSLKNTDIKWNFRRRWKNYLNIPLSACPV